jgi:hypothetical protein
VKQPKIVTVNYRGESPMWVDVVGGQSGRSWQLPVFATVQLRGVKAIGVTGSHLQPSGVPTLTQQGIEGRLVTRGAVCH